MKYMLMMHAPRGTGDWDPFKWAPEDLKAHMDFMHRLNKDLADTGELVGCEGLSGPAEAMIVRAGKNGLPARWRCPRTTSVRSPLRTLQWM